MTKPIFSGDRSTKTRLHQLYRSPNPAELKKRIDDEIRELYKIYQEKNNSHSIEAEKKQTPHTEVKELPFQWHNDPNLGYLVEQLEMGLWGPLHGNLILSLPLPSFSVLTPHFKGCTI